VQECLKLGQRCCPVETTSLLSCLLTQCFLRDTENTQSSLYALQVKYIYIALFTI